MGDLDTPEGLDSQELLKHTKKWTEEMYDWWEADGGKKCMEYVKSDNSNMIVYIEYDYHQIGKTEEWFTDIANKINDPLTVRREILLQRLKGSDASPYPRADIDYIIEIGHRPIRTILLKEYYRLDIYEELDRNIPYLVGVDCSTGTVADNNAFTIINPYTLLPVAEFECSYVGETIYEQILKELVTKYIPRAILCIERNSVGDSIIDHLMYSSIAGNLYFDKSKDLMAETMKSYESVESMLKSNAKKKLYYGVYTTGKSRDSMFSILSNHVSNHKEKFVTQNVIRDLSGLVRKSSGKIEAGPKMHDDSIMSYLIALYVYYHGDNLALFGFDPGDAVKIDSVGLSRPDDIYTKNIPTDVANEIHDVMKKEQNKDNYEEELRKALLQSQQESLRLHSKNLVENDIIDNTPDYMLTDYEERSGSIDLGLFDQLNNFSMNGVDNNGSGLF